MTTHQIARWFDGLRNWLADDLNKQAVKNLTEFSEAIRDLPDKPFKELVKDIKLLQNGGIPALIEEMKSLQDRSGGAADKIIARIKNLKKPELSAISNALGLPNKKTVNESKRMLLEYIGSPNGSNSTSNGAHTAPGGLSHEVDAGYRDYCTLRDALESLSISDIRVRFESLRRFSRPVLDGIAQRLGYHFNGSKDEVFGQLLQTLEGMKINRVNKEIIESM